MDTETAMRAVLLELTMLQHGSTTCWNPTTTGTRERDPRPSGDSYPIAEEYRDRYAAAPGDIARRRVLHEARAELEQWRGHGVKRHAGESGAVQDARMVREGKGWTVDEVSRAFSCTKTRVRKACAEHGVEIDYQDRLCAAGAVSRSSMALAMSDAGTSQEDIAKALDISQPTVSRVLATARASKVRLAA